MMSSWGLPIAAAVLVVVTAIDWMRRGGGVTPKRRTWLFIAAIFLAVTWMTRS